MNLLDLFENQLHGQPGRPVLPTDFDLPIPELSEELWPLEVQPEANVPNEDVQNADVPNADAQGSASPQIDDQEIGNVENFEDFQSSPIRPAALDEPQPIGLPPIPEVDNADGLYIIYYT